MGELLLTKPEAAAFCRVSVRTFEIRIQPYVSCYPVGRKPLFKADDLRTWQDAQKIPPPRTILRESISAPRTSRVQFATTRGAEILAELTGPSRRRTRV